MSSQEYWERRRKAVEEQLQQYREETPSNKFQVPIPQLQKFFAKKQEATESPARTPLSTKKQEPTESPTKTPLPKPEVLKGGLKEKKLTTAESKGQRMKEEPPQRSGASVLKIFGIVGAVLVVFLLVLSIFSGSFSKITGLASSELSPEAEEAQTQGQQKSFTQKIRDLFVVKIPVP